MPVTLTPAQIESVREMVGDKTYATVSVLIDDLEDAQRTATVSDVAQWDARKNKRHIRMAGGSDGIDLNNDRMLITLRRRVRDRLGLSVSSSGGIFYIPVVAGYSNACDS